MVVFKAQICRNKKVISLAWHPKEDGILAASYVSEPFNCILNRKLTTKVAPENESFQKNNLNATLIWNCVDFLKPKFVLNSFQEVTVLSFCPFKIEGETASFLIGGCSNGQLVLWDLNNCSNGMVTATSSVEKSHSLLIHSLYWWPENCFVTKNGKLVEIMPKIHTDRTLQFLTSSVDGLILIWDLNMKIKPIRRNITNFTEKLENYTFLRKKLLDPIANLSPYSNLNQLLQPFYTISVKGILNQVKEDFLKPVSSLHQLSGAKIMCGTTEGHIILLKFEGHDDSVSKMFSNYETANVHSDIFLHDGPVTRIISCPLLDQTDEIILTIGGHIFALWKPKEIEPFLSYRNPQAIYTGSIWSLWKATIFYLTTENGCLELWDLKIKCGKPTEIYQVSGQTLTGVWISSQFLTIADADGSLRLFSIPKQHHLVSNGPHNDNDGNDGDLENEVCWFCDFVLHEVRRKQMISDWKSKHSQLVASISSDIQKWSVPSRINDVVTCTESIKDLNKSNEIVDIELEMKLQEVLYVRKNLKKADLEKKQKPLKNLEQKEQQKKIKIQEKIQKRESFFEDLKALNFPEISNAKQCDQLEKELAFTKDESHAVLDEINELENEYTKAAGIHNRFHEKIKFSWKTYVENGKRRRQIISD